MKQFYVSIALVGILSLSSTASAEPGDISIGMKGGTLGLGLEAGVDISNYFEARAGINYLKFDFDTTISQVDYNFEQEFFNGSLLLDLHPFANAFRLTAGAYINNNKTYVEGTYRKDLIPAEYDSLSYLTDLAKVKGTVEYNTFAPYVGIGWTSNHASNGWGVNLDLGVMFQGSPTVSELYIEDPWGLGDHPAVIRILDDEKQEIQDELDKFEYYPVASLSVSYKF